MELPTPQIKNSLVLIMSFFLIVTVIIAGLFYFQIKKLSKELSKYQAQPSPTPTANLSGAKPKDWKTYTSKELGFSLKYPQSWPDPEISPLSTRTEVVFNENLTIIAGVYFNQELNRELTFDEFIDQRKPTDNRIYEYSLSQSPGKRLIYKIGEILQEIIIAAPFPDKRNIITINYKIYPGDTSFPETIDQILSTFKFLDQLNAEGKFCGGIAANLPENQCPGGFYCKLDGSYPDAGGVCTKLTEQIPAISDLDLSMGWYYGTKDQKKPNTPQNWIYTEAGRSSCWHKPDTQCGFLPD